MPDLWRRASSALLSRHYEHIFRNRALDKSVDGKTPPAVDFSMKLKKTNVGIHGGGLIGGVHVELRRRSNPVDDIRCRDYR